MKRLFLTFMIFPFAPFYLSCDGIRANLIEAFSPEYSPEGDTTNLTAEFSGKDSNRDKLNIKLNRIADGFAQITEFMFYPGNDRYLIVLQKGGKLISLDLKSGKREILLELNVATTSEQGLLGIAFHPQFSSNRKVYLNYSIEDPTRKSRVSEFKMSGSDSPGNLSGERVLMEVEQPYQNHNAGRLDFGPDGMLYIGWGDGGWRDDPHENGQNARTMLGSMLRINVNKKDTGKEYAIPTDNPRKTGWLPEAYAIGLRNPWKYSFSSDGRLIVADVGQNKWEEVSIVRSGENLGWNTMEATHCFDPADGCNKSGLKLPFYEYDHEEGKSITGGYECLSDEIPELKGKYIFGDFISGRIWAVEIPQEKAESTLVEANALGKWPLLISSFGRDNKGNIYVANFSDGSIYKIVK